MALDKADLIKTIKWNLARYRITREDLEKALDWEEDTIHGVPLESFDALTLRRMRWKIEEIVLRDHKIKLDPGRFYRIR